MSCGAQVGGPISCGVCAVWTVRKPVPEGAGTPPPPVWEVNETNKGQAQPNTEQWPADAALATRQAQLGEQEQHWTGSGSSAERDRSNTVKDFGRSTKQTKDKDSPTTSRGTLFIHLDDNGWDSLSLLGTKTMRARLMRGGALDSAPHWQKTVGGQQNKPRTSTVQIDRSNDIRQWMEQFQLSLARQSSKAREMASLDGTQPF